MNRKYIHQGQTVRNVMVMKRHPHWLYIKEFAKMASMFLFLFLFFLIIGCFIPLHNKGFTNIYNNISLSLNTQIDKNTKSRN